MAAINSGTSYSKRQRNTGTTYGSRKKAIDRGPKKPPTPRQPTAAMRERAASGMATKSDMRTIRKHNKFTKNFGKIGTQRGRNQGRLNNIKADGKGGMHGHGSRTVGRGVDNTQKNSTGAGNVNQHRNVGGKSGRYSRSHKAGQSFRKAKAIAKKALRVLDKATSRVFGPIGIPLPPSVLRMLRPQGPGDQQT